MRASACTYGTIKRGFACCFLLRLSFAPTLNRDMRALAISCCALALPAHCERRIRQLRVTMHCRLPKTLRAM